jgi:mRNA interferase YafQ
MLQVEYTTQFKRDLRLAKKRNKNLGALREIMKKIEHEEKLSLKLKDHILSNNWIGHRELHIEPDWLLIYKLIHKDNVVIFVRTGTHSDLF